MSCDVLSVQAAPAPLDVEAAAFVQAAASRIRGHVTKVAESIISIGRELIQVKERLDHGQFGRWLESEFAWSDRTARNYMRAAEVFGEIGNGVSDLPPSTIYKLASPSTPPAIVGDVVAKLERREPVDPRGIEAEIAAARAQKTKQKRAPAAAAPEPAQDYVTTRWKRDADAAAIARTVITAITYEPHTADLARLVSVLQAFISPNDRGSTTAVKLAADKADARSRTAAFAPAQVEFPDLPAFLDRRTPEVRR
jgi:hypothetical protein